MSRSSESRVGLFEAIRRRITIVAISTLAVGAAALLVSLLQDPRYEASATVAVSGDGEATDRDAVLELARADEVAEEAGERLGGADPEFVSSRIDVSSGDFGDAFLAGIAELFTVEAHSGEPDEAADLANEFAGALVAFIDRRADSVAGGAEVLRSAEPPADPVSPKTVRNTVGGLLAGLVLGVVVAIVAGRVDHRVWSAGELDGLIGVPLLARIPVSPALGLDHGLRELPAADSEMFQMTLTGMRHLHLDRDIGSVLVTSAQPGDGKTTVAFGLASCAATSGDRVLLIEADMRRPGLAAVAEPVQSGLGAALEGKLSWPDAVSTVEVTTGADGVSGSVDLLLAGPAPANPAPLVESRRMTQLVREAEGEYDLVLIDTPPARILPDAIPLLGQVDGVIVVAGLLHDTREQLRELRDRLDQVDAPLIGMVANFSGPPDESYLRYIRAHEAAVAEAGTVPLRPAPSPPRRRSERRAGEPTVARPATVPTPEPERTPPKPEPQRAPLAGTEVVPLPDGPVDLNATSFEELRALDLSITQARRLLRYRERWGGFSSLDQLDEVPGFPQGVLAELKRRVKV